MLKSILTSKVGWSGIATTVIWLLTTALPVLPPVWGNFVTAILGLLTFYHIGQAVTGARAAGAKGI